jgi:hypothetical protein
VNRRHRQRGAASLVGLTLCFLVFAVGTGITLITAQRVAVARAQVTADSVAHAAAGFLAADSKREALSRELQMHFTCQYQSRSALQLDSAAGGDATDANQLCYDAFNTARSAMAANDKTATLVAFAVTTDSRDYVDSGGATRLDVAVTVQLPSPLAKFPAFCRTPDGGSWCDAAATSAARESG